MQKQIDIQPALELFTQRSRQFDASVDAQEVERAIVLLGRWISREHRWLTKDDIAVLGDIGATLLRANAVIKDGDEDALPSQPRALPMVPV